LLLVVRQDDLAAGQAGDFLDVGHFDESCKRVRFRRDSSMRRMFREAFERLLSDSLLPNSRVNVLVWLDCML
jgi:hypothetical protein